MSEPMVSKRISTPIPKSAVRVIVMDDDPLACAATAYLLRRDLRIQVVATVNSPQQLLGLFDAGISVMAAGGVTENALPQKGKVQGNIHVILVDMDYVSPISVYTLITRLRRVMPDTVFLCHSQLSSVAQLQRAYDSGAAGLIIKGDVRYALATVLTRAWCERTSGYFWITPRLTRAAALLQRTRLFPLPAWDFHPDIAERHKVTFKCVMFGMSVKAIADETGYATDTIREYIRDIQEIYDDYTLVFDDKDISSVIDLLQGRYKRERTFHYATLLKRSG